jgi:ABC-type transport system involved in multi-copper enzyme maturation permease subunit
LLVIIRWPADATANLSGRQAQQIFRVFGYGLLVGMMLLVPVFPATSIVREKQTGTLALLLNSPMSSWQIMSGKLFASFGFTVLMLVASLPAAAACYAMSGVDLIDQFGKTFLILILVAVQYSALGLAISGYASTTDSSLRLTFGSILMLSVMTLVPHLFLQTLLEGPARVALDWIRCVSPVPAMMEVLGDSRIVESGLMTTDTSTGRFVLASVVLTIIFIVIGTRRLNARIFDRPRSKGKVTDERSKGAQLLRRFMYMWFFDPQRRSSLIGPMSNPVTVKEFRSRRFGRSHWMMRLIFLCMIVSLGLMLVASKATMVKGTETFGAIMVLLQIALIVLITPSLAGGLISSEIEGKGWDLLLLTPLSALKIVSGKLMSVGSTLLLVMVATLPGYAIMIIIDDAQIQRVISVLITLALTAVFSLLLTAAVSSLIPRTAAATATSYAVLIAMVAGTMLVWLGREAPFAHGTVESVMRLNPLAAALFLIQAPGFTQYQVLPYNWWFTGGASVVCLMVLFAQVWRLTRPR